MKLRKERIALEVKLREVEARLSEKEQRLTEELEVKEGRLRCSVPAFRTTLCVPGFLVFWSFPELRTFVFLLGCRPGLSDLYRTAGGKVRGVCANGRHIQGEERQAES